MESVLHIIGLCSDTHSHIDIIDILFYGGISSSFFLYMRSSIKNKIIALFNKKQRKDLKLIKKMILILLNNDYGK